jgi:hypothetical protein
MKGAITIVAGGFSASLVDLKSLPGFVIAVNDAAIYAPKIDCVVSMDRLWTEARFDIVSKFGVPVYLRRSTLKNVKWEGVECVTRFECDHNSTTLSDEPGILNGTHSGFCALNLAYSMRPRQIYLVGFDMQRGPRGEQHWYPPYPWSKNSTGQGRLTEWGGQFRQASMQLTAAGIKTAYVAASSRPFPFAWISPSQLGRECSTGNN